MILPCTDSHAISIRPIFSGSMFHDSPGAPAASMIDVAPAGLAVLAASHRCWSDSRGFLVEKCADFMVISW